MVAVLKYIGLFCGLFLATDALADTPLQLNFSGVRGYEIPIPGSHVFIDSVLVAPDGRLLFEVDGFVNGKIQSNYWDIKEEKWFFTEPIREPRKLTIANKMFHNRGYKPLGHMPELGFKDGRKVTNILHVGDVCFRPYANFLTFISPQGENGEDGEVVERALYMRLNQPEEIFSAADAMTEPHMVASSHTCKDSSGNSPTLVRNYRQQSAFFFSDNASGFFGLISRYAIHFDSTGDSDFFKGRDNPVLMSAEDTAKIKDILIKANGSRSPQDAVNQVEAMIEQTAQAQKAMQP